MKMLRAILGLLRARRLAVLVLAAAILLPVFFAPRIVLSGGTFSYLFVIDVSESMNVRDVDARNRIRGTACRIGHDELDRTGRIFGPSALRRGHNEAANQSRRQCAPVHACPPAFFALPDTRAVFTPMESERRSGFSF